MVATFKYEDIKKLKDGLTYEKETITTMTLYKQDAKMVAGLAFDRGQSILPCKSESNLTLQIIEGRAEVMIAGINYDIQEGEEIIMPKNKIHALFAKTKLKLALLKE